MSNGVGRHAACGTCLPGLATRALGQPLDGCVTGRLTRPRPARVSPPPCSYLTINSNSKAASEVHLLPADLRAQHSVTTAGSGGPPAAPATAEPRLVQARTPGLEYFVEHNSGQLYLLSNARGAENYAVFRRVARTRVRGTCGRPALSTQLLPMHARRRPTQPARCCPRRRVPAASPSLAQEQWRVVVGEEAGVATEDMDMARHHLVLYQRRQGRQQVAALPLHDGLPAASAALQTAPLPGWALSVAAGANADLDSDRLRLMLSSPVHPEVAYEWHLSSGQLEARQVPPALAADAPPASGPGAGELGWRQLWATSHDGTAVPLTVAHAAGSSSSSTGGSEAPLPPPSDPRPCLLVVYGAYGHCLPTDFLAERLPLLRRGWVLALAHVRGGGELGRRWHAGGRGAHKANSAADLEACLDLLVSTGGWVLCGSVGEGGSHTWRSTPTAHPNRLPNDLSRRRLHAGGAGGGGGAQRGRPARRGAAQPPRRRPGRRAAGGAVCGCAVGHGAAGPAPDGA